MAAMPPPGESNYPRAQIQAYGSAEKLEALGAGYHGLTQAFLINIVFLVATVACAATNQPLLYLAMLAALLIQAGIVSYPANKKVAMGMGWSPGSAVGASIGIALSSWFCFGAIGFAIMQSIATKELKNYGLNPKRGGFKKPVIQARVDELRAAEASLAGVTRVGPTDA